jgi:FkbM family methyltransferase
MLINIFKRNKREDKRKEIISFYSQFVPQGGLVFDIGANIGNRIEIFLELGANVVAVEPQAACIAILKKKFGNKISIEHTGLSSSEGVQEFHIADESTISTFSKEFILKTGADRFKRNKWKETITVPVTTFDRLIKKYGVPDFTKIDVEGFESEVLKGLTSGIPAFSFEYCVPEMAENLSSCLQRANTLDSSASYNYSVGETFQMKLNEWRSFSEFLPLVKEKSFHKTLFGDIYTKSSV